MLNEAELNRLNHQQQAIYAGYNPAQKDQFASAMRAQWANEGATQRSPMRDVGVGVTMVSGIVLCLVALSVDAVPAFAMFLAPFAFPMGCLFLVGGVIEERLIQINATLTSRSNAD